MKKFTSASQKKGKLAENIAVFFLERKGYKIIERNFTLSSGEIDIVAFRKGYIHFVEVKSSFFSERNVSCETFDPFDSVTKEKSVKIERTSHAYLKHCKNIRYKDYQYDVICVYIDNYKKHIRIEHIMDAF